MQSSSCSSVLASSSTPQKSPKNWQAAFGQLASTYGFAGNIPSLPKKTQTKKSSVTTSKASIYSNVSSQSTLTESRSTKDYETAFGQLSTSYGIVAGVPCLPSKASKSTKSSTSKSPSRPSIVDAQPTRNYRQSYGELSSTYGHGSPIATRL